MIQYITAQHPYPNSEAGSKHTTAQPGIFRLKEV